MLETRARGGTADTDALRASDRNVMGVRIPPGPPYFRRHSMSKAFSPEENLILKDISCIERDLGSVTDDLTRYNSKIASLQRELNEYNGYAKGVQDKIDRFEAVLADYRDKLCKLLEIPPLIALITDKADVSEDGFDALESRSNVERPHAKAKSKHSTG